MRLERKLIGMAMRRPTSAADVAALAAGTGNAFAAWRVAARTEHDILLPDITGRTASWLKVVPLSPTQTRLCFGSAVVPRKNGKMGFAFHALLGFHEWYSRALLTAAAKALCTRRGH
jgi:hypothetical protein